MTLIQRRPYNIMADYTTIILPSAIAGFFTLLITSINNRIASKREIKQEAIDREQKIEELKDLADKNQMDFANRLRDDLKADNEVLRMATINNGKSIETLKTQAKDLTEDRDHWRRQTQVVLEQHAELRIQFAQAIVDRDRAADLHVTCQKNYTKLMSDMEKMQDQIGEVKEHINQNGGNKS